MEFLKNLKAFLVSIIAFLVRCSKLVLKQSQQPTLPSPPPLNSTSDPETPLTNHSSLSTNDVPDETLQAQSPAPPLPSTFNVELPQPRNTSSDNQPETSQHQESIQHQAQRHQQWVNTVLSFCFSYALAISLQYSQTNHQANHDEPHFSFVLLSFLVLLAFNITLVASFIRPSCPKTSEVLEKVAFLVAAIAFFQATAISFPFELKCTVFLLAFLLITRFEYLKRNIA